MLLEILIQVETSINYIEGGFYQYSTDEVMVQTGQEHVYQPKEKKREAKILTGENHITLRIQMVRAKFTRKTMSKRRTNK